MDKVRLLLQKLKQNKKLSIVVVVVLIAVIGTGAYFFRPHPAPKTKTVTIPPEQQAQQELQKQRNDMLATVEKQIALPKDEEPVFATVSDKEKLQDQEFFADAQNGDKILMYKKNKKAFLYRPSTKQVLAEAPLVFEEPKEATESAETDESSTAIDESPQTQSEPLPTTKPRGKILIQPQ